MNCHTHSIACGYNKSLIISTEGNLFSLGYSFYGALGYTSEVFPPKAIPTLRNILSVCLGDYHSVCLDNEGNVFTLGGNCFGQLGVGDESLEQTHIPQKVNVPPCKHVSSGYHFTVCLTNDGLIYSFGINDNGELGLGNNEKKYYSPQLIESLNDIEFIECGNNHTFCKTLNNQVYCWGFNEDGPLGLGNRDNQNTPILCSSVSNEDVVDIKCGSIHTLILTSNGDLLSCGDNKFGQLGRETDDDYSSSFQKIEELPEITRFECGNIYSICIDANKDLYIFGNNKFGQLGLGDDQERKKPVKHPSLSNVIDVSHGGYHTFVKTSENEIYAFGLNEGLQLGIQTPNDIQNTPIRVFTDNEAIWHSNNIKSKAKSARF